jgi:alpha-ketoglutarate-dependent taurine dioxygenase
VLDARDLTPRIGSEVVTDAATLLAGTHAAAIRELLVQRGVLVMRGIDFDDDQQRAFTLTMGELRIGSPYEKAAGGMLKITDIAGTYFWHMDGVYHEVPPFATVLTPRVVAPVGGETEFANTYAAFEDLPEEEREHLETLEVLHSMKSAMDHAIPEPTLEQFEQWLGYKRTQPLAWQHTSGRTSLVLGSTAAQIVGMHPADSRALLDRLVAHATQDQYVYRHTWALGDLVLWDNTGTMHRVRPFDLGSGREMHRFTVEGIEPFARVTALSPA